MGWKQAEMDALWNMKVECRESRVCWRVCVCVHRRCLCVCVCVERRGSSRWRWCAARRTTRKQRWTRFGCSSAYATRTQTTPHACAPSSSSTTSKSPDPTAPVCPLLLLILILILIPFSHPLYSPSLPPLSSPIPHVPPVPFLTYHSYLRILTHRYAQFDSFLAFFLIDIEEIFRCIEDFYESIDGKTFQFFSLVPIVWNLIPRRGPRVWGNKFQKVQAVVASLGSGKVSEFSKNPSKWFFYDILKRSTVWIFPLKIWWNSLEI